MFEFDGWKKNFEVLVEYRELRQVDQAVKALSV